MAHPEDPPYLTVGTEVSAKYRGAFCEATIKTAKKLVKCKVSYGKGQSTIVTTDLIKGPLKVGGQVEVRQGDGQTQHGTIAKLTDHSTYTVVFDDGDERTLKRSSLCLKGGRHFHESESLDHLPLTDPENFGTPVMNATSKKTGRKRRRGSHSPSSIREGPFKRGCSYPPEFPVGKAVFLENDRRRSSWLPAVIVPAHYVLEAADMTPDTICLRSFKDGRFFAATKNELHEFSPDKEPLLSMLEKEIQAMYMCKPAIEKAMAYIDTGKLPWDMNLFDANSQQSSHGPSSSHLPGSDPSISDDDDPQGSKDESLSAESKDFELQLEQFHASRGTSMQRPAVIGQHDLNLLFLHRLVKANGGMDRVTQEMKWRSLCLQLGLPLGSSASQSLRQAYKRYLYQFELHESKAKGAGKEGVAKGGAKESGAVTRGSKTLLPSSDEEQDLSNQQLDKTREQDTPNQQDKIKQQDKPNQQQDKTKQQDKSIQQQGKTRQQDKLKRQDKLQRVPDKVKTEQAEKGSGSTAKSNHVLSDNDGGGDSEGVSKVNGLDKGGRKVIMAEQKSIKMKIEKVYEPPTSPSPPPSALQTESEEEKNSASDGSKSEGSDVDSAQLMTSSSAEMWSRGEMERNYSSSTVDLERGGIGAEGLQQCPDGYKENDRVLVLYGKGKALRTYEAKVIDMDVGEGKEDYLVHYSGWNNRYDEWIDSTRIAGKIIGAGKPRPHFNKRRKTPKSASSSTLFKHSKLPPGSPSSAKLVLTPPPSLSASMAPPGPVTPAPVPPSTSPPPPSSSTSPSKLLLNPSTSKILLSPSLQAIISAHAQQQQNSHIKETIKGIDTISGKDIASKGPIHLVTTVRRGGRSDRSRNKRMFGPTTTSAVSSPNNTTFTAGSPTPSMDVATPSSSEEAGSGQENDPIIVKQEENQMWSASPPPPSPPSPAADLDTPLAPPTNALETDVPSALLCSELLPGLVPKHISTTSPPSSQSAISLAEPAAQSLLSLSTSIPSFSTPTNHSPHTQHHSLPKNSEPLHFSSPGATSGTAVEDGYSPQHSPGLKGEWFMEQGSVVKKGELEDLVYKHQDSLDVSSVGSEPASSLEDGGLAPEQKYEYCGSGSEKEGSPLPNSSVSHQSPCSLSFPEGKRKWHLQQQETAEGKRKWHLETAEEFQRRKKARHDGMNYTLDFCQLPPMNSVKRISLIQDHLRDVQRHWTDLKTELAYIERKKRRTKRKEKEAGESCSSPPAPPPSPPPQPHPHPSAIISCH